MDMTTELDCGCCVHASTVWTWLCARHLRQAASRLRRPRRRARARWASRLVGNPS